jgi:hypothetical protein
MPLASLPLFSICWHFASDRYFRSMSEHKFSADFFWNADGAFSLRCRVHGRALRLAYGLSMRGHGTYPFASVWAV